MPSAHRPGCKSTPRLASSMRVVLKAQCRCIQSGEFHAVVGGQAKHIDGWSTPLFLRKSPSPVARRLPLSKKTAVAIDLGVGALLKDCRPLFPIQDREQNRLQVCSGHSGPAKGFEPDHRDRLPRPVLFARMIRRKAAMVGWVPILSGHDQVKAAAATCLSGEQAPFLPGTAKRSAFDEVILHIDDDQCVHSSKLKPFFFSCRYLVSSKR